MIQQVKQNTQWERLRDVGTWLHPHVLFFLSMMILQTRSIHYEVKKKVMMRPKVEGCDWVLLWIFGRICHPKL